jgi:beta-lactamase regulating signal transducer with metallopeptidase domain
VSALLQIALSNAVAATALGIVAALAACVLRRPPLTRALWVLVLLKLLTPPVWHVQMPRLGVTTDTHADATVLPVTRAAAEIRLPADDSPVDSQILSALPANEPADVPSVVSPKAARPTVWRQVIGSWPWAVAIVWIAGSAVHLVLLAMSILRIRQLARSAEPADDGTRQRARQLAGRLGLRHFPNVLFVQGPLSPMLCAIGVRPRLLLPRELWERLDERQRDTVLTHELAHLRRRDHWVRTLEVLVAALYWWHPVVWYARRALREASEQCCDAWVLWALPRSAASYATALIEAIDFISTVRPAVPALASGMGQFTDLKRRLVMIRQGTAAKTLSWPGFTGICAAAGLLLPLAPTFAQVTAETTPANKTTAEVAPVGAQVASVGTSAETVTSVTVPDGLTTAVEVESAGNDSNVAPGVEAARRDVERARAQLARAEERLARLEGRQAGRGGGGGGGGSFGSATGQFGRGRAGATSAAERGAANRIGTAAGGDQQQRLDALENQVREILNELRQMKREQRGRTQSSGETQVK